MLVSTLALPFQSDSSLTDKVDKLFAQYDKHGSPGCALGVIKDGRFIYTRGYGSANLDYDIPLSVDSVFFIASTSKQFTAASIALLAQQGKISLEDDIRKYLPEIPDYGTPITIQHLIHHTSGIRDYLTLWDLAAERFDDVHSMPDFIALICRQKALNFKPGDEYLYSNSGYLLLGEIVKRVSGKSLREFAHEQIFAPLGMLNTHFHDDRSLIVKNRVTAYEALPDGKFSTHVGNFELVGDGGLMTSVADLLKWDQNFYTARVGGQAFINQIQTLGKLDNGETLDYAFALTIAPYRGLKTVSHAGSGASYRTDFVRFPEQKFSVICLCNVANANPSRLARQVAEIYLADEIEKREGKGAMVKTEFITLPEKELIDKIGAYRKFDTNQVLRISHQKGRLLVDGAGQQYRLGPISPTDFRSVDASQEMTARFESLGRQSGFRVHVTIGTQRPVTYVSFQPITLNAAQLEEYVGSYYSEELAATYQFVQKDGKLLVKRRNAPEMELDPVVKDVFQGRRLTVEFVRSKDRRISHFLVNAGRVRGVRFERRPTRNVDRN